MRDSAGNRRGTERNIPKGWNRLLLPGHGKDANEETVCLGKIPSPSCKGTEEDPRGENGVKWPTTRVSQGVDAVP